MGDEGRPYTAAHVTAAGDTAAQLGRDAARAAASWANDRGSTEDAQRLLQMIEDGDPAVWDLLPARPNLSGEWADSWTRARLVEACDSWPDLTGYLCDRWETAVDSEFEAAVVRELRGDVPADWQPASTDDAGAA